MELVSNLLLSALIAALLSYLLEKLFPLAVSGGGKELDGGVDNGDAHNHKGRLGGSGLKEKNLKVKGSMSKTKRSKKISAETVVVSEFKGESEQPPVSAHILGGLSGAGDSVDDSDNLGSLTRDFEFPGERVGFSGLSTEGDCFGLVKCRLVGELDMEPTNQGNDSEKLFDFDCENEMGTETIESKRDETVGAQYEFDVQNEDFEFCVSKESVISENVGGEMKISDGEEWEGVEKNELEKDFARALSYVESVKKEGGLITIGSDVIMQFDDLQKFAMEGPCHEPNVSANTDWNSWEKLESMNPEEAMEKYITLLSDKVPGWMDSHPSVESKLGSEKDDTFRSSSYTALNLPLTAPLACANGSKPGEKLVPGYLDGRSTSVNKEMLVYISPCISSITRHEPKDLVPNYDLFLGDGSHALSFVASCINCEKATYTSQDGE